MTKSAKLEALRREIDRLDREIHDRLMARAQLVGRIGRLKTGFALRPGREARVLRALLARHRGGLPRKTLVQLWREIISALTQMQTPFAVGYVAMEGGGLKDLARDHFGTLTPLVSFRSSDAVISAVGSGRVQAGVLPEIANTPEGRWWSRLGTVQIVARLPFLAESRARDAWLVAALGAEASGDDVTLIEIRDKKGGRLVEVEGFVASDDASFRKLCEIAGGAKACRRLGAYARPLTVSSREKRGQK